ncbi:PREDICTED: uncharacterized protein LOC104787671 [Camelina sativa]|uniref:Uncharacterized protein LOC104787671 n=1 Tax=Camelina sativa TaxID=90675 RepID=A0ABM1RRE3_CAMSA|nr:PREDICTED: uncharacterized protein LOC104787671 [Camelina sativa]
MELINWRIGPLKEESKSRIRKGFQEATGHDLEWLSLKNKIYSFKKLYDVYCRLIEKTGVGLDPTTLAIDMNDSWWNERIKETPIASKLRANPLIDLDILDRLFSTKHINSDHIASNIAEEDSDSDEEL